MLSISYIKSHIVSIMKDYERITKERQDYKVFNMRLCFSYLSRSEIDEVVGDFIDLLEPQTVNERFSTIMSLQTTTFENQLIFDKNN